MQGWFGDELLTELGTRRQLVNPAGPQDYVFIMNHLCHSWRDAANTSPTAQLSKYFENIRKHGGLLLSVPFPANIALCP